MKNKISLYLRVTIGILILFSIATMYYTKIVLKDYEIIANEEGPTLDE